MGFHVDIRKERFSHGDGSAGGLGKRGTMPMKLGISLTNKGPTTTERYPTKHFRKRG